MQDTLITAIKVYSETNLPGFLSAEGAEQMEEYYDYRLDNPSKRIFTVFPATQKKSEDQQKILVICKAQLPKIINIKKHSDAIDKFTDTLRAYMFKYTTLTIVQINMYPGEVGSGGAGGNIELELEFEKIKTSCN